jgi:hypothetical protein
LVMDPIRCVEKLEHVAASLPGRRGVVKS